MRSNDPPGWGKNEKQTKISKKKKKDQKLLN